MCLYIMLIVTNFKHNFMRYYNFIKDFVDLISDDSTP